MYQGQWGLTSKYVASKMVSMKKAQNKVIIDSSRRTKNRSFEMQYLQSPALAVSSKKITDKRATPTIPSVWNYKYLKLT